MHAGQHLLSIQGKVVLLCIAQHYLGYLENSPFDVISIGELILSRCLSQAVQSATVDLVRCLENVANSCSQLLWFQWVKNSLHKISLSWHSGDMYFFKWFFFSDILSPFNPYALGEADLNTSITLFTLLLPLFKARHYQTPGFSSGSAEHGQFSGGQAVHEPYGVAQAQHPSSYAPGPSVPVSFASSSQIRGKGHVSV